MDKLQYIKMEKNESKHFWFIGRREIIKKILSKHIKKRKDNKILEIGVGTGGNIQILSEYGEYFGIESSMVAKEILKHKNKNKNIIYGFYPEKKYKEKFDIITLFDVLEHIEEDETALKSIYDNLSENGKLIITVPAFNFLWSNHDVIHHHKRRYNKKELKEKIEKAGFTISKISYFNFFLFPLVLITRLIKKVLKLELKEEEISSNIVNNILKKIFLLETKIINNFNLPFGSSIIVVCKK